MSQRWLLPLAAVAAATPALADTNYRYVHRPNDDTYFGHISYCELKHDGADPSIVRAEGAELPALNMPVAPGDALVTTAGRRCEAQFDTGTLLRLDENSSLLIETILASSLTTKDKLTNMHLQQGRIRVMYRDYDSHEVFQVLTPNAAVKLVNAAVVDVLLGPAGETIVEVAQGQAVVLFGPSIDKTTTRRLIAGMRATIQANDEMAAIVSARERPKDAFDVWNKQINDRFQQLHAGKSDLPKPIDRFPRAVLSFAQQYGDLYGEWVWSDLYGYVWRPRLASDDWRPYMSGRWVPISGRLFWVPEETWGWVPYHLGLWHFDKKHGWVWLPGAAFAPAWVTWSVCDDVRYFRPLTLWDWTLRSTPGYRYARVRSGDPCGLYPSWFDDPSHNTTTVVLALPAAPVVPTPIDEGHGPKPIRQIPDRPVLPLPSDFARIVKKAEEAVKRAEPGVREAIDVTTRTLRPAEIPKPSLAAAGKELFSTRSPGERFRDHNADVRAARNLGGTIVYSSVTNMVRCESCMRPMTSFNLLANQFGDGGRGDSSGSNNSGNSSSSSSGGASSSGVGTGAGPSGEQGRSGGERIR